MTRIILVLLALLGCAQVLGCAQLPPVDARAPRPPILSSERPAWVDGFEAPDDDLYGVGSGSSLALATRSALTDVAASLSISVADQVTFEVRQIGDHTAEQLQHRLRAEVARTQFSDWKRIKSVALDGIYFALVRVDRERLIRDLAAELASLEATLSHRLEPASALSALRYWAAYRDSQRELERAQEIGVLLPGLDAAFDPGPHRQRLRDWQDRYEFAMTDMSFGIVSHGQMSEVAQVVETLLTRARLPVQSMSHCEIGQGVCIEVTGSVTTRRVGADHISVIKSSWALRDESGELISTTPHQFTGSSKLGELEAEQDARRKMYEALKPAGIGSALGFQRISSR